MTRLVSAVTEQVLRALAQGGADCPADSEGLPKALALGDTDRLPEGVFRRCVKLTLEDYRRHGNILKYDRVIIGSMTTLQLSSLALGLPADDFCRAVMDALLNGVEVCMANDAPEHRALAGKGGNALYALLEGYARQLLVFGVKPLDALLKARETSIEPPRPPEQRLPQPKYESHARPNRDKLVTEAGALKLCAKAENGTLRFERGVLITPAARDVFAAAGITVLIE